mmetsp:Transcript_30577/g.54986  ORF Transcript_30577/g.54986 Transcript_30577/m.54986 type:complete len:238 (+) Transcript_30577:114-827(+)
MASAITAARSSEAHSTRWACVQTRAENGPSAQWPRHGRHSAGIEPGSSGNVQSARYTIRSSTSMSTWPWAPAASVVAYRHRSSILQRAKGSKDPRSSRLAAWRTLRWGLPVRTSIMACTTSSVAPARLGMHRSSATASRGAEYCRRRSTSSWYTRGWPKHACSILWARARSAACGAFRARKQTPLMTPPSSASVSTRGRPSRCVRGCPLQQRSAAYHCCPSGACIPRASRWKPMLAA